MNITYESICCRNGGIVTDAGVSINFLLCSLGGVGGAELDRDLVVVNVVKFLDTGVGEIESRFVGKADLCEVVDVVAVVNGRDVGDNLGVGDDVEDDVGDVGGAVLAVLDVSKDVGVAVVNGVKLHDRVDVEPWTRGTQAGFESLTSGLEVVDAEPWIVGVGIKAVTELVDVGRVVGHSSGTTYKR